MCVDKGIWRSRLDIVFLYFDSIFLQYVQISVLCHHVQAVTIMDSMRHNMVSTTDQVLLRHHDLPARTGRQHDDNEYSLILYLL